MRPPTNPPRKRLRLETANHEGGDRRRDEDNNDGMRHTNHHQQSHQHNHQDQGRPINNFSTSNGNRIAATAPATSSATANTTVKETNYTRLLRVKQEIHKENMQASFAANQSNSESMNNPSTQQNVSVERNTTAVNHRMEDTFTPAPRNTGQTIKGEGSLDNSIPMVNNVNTATTDTSSSGNTAGSSRVKSEQIQQRSATTHDSGIQNNTTAVAASISSSKPTHMEASVNTSQLQEGSRNVFYSADDIHRMQNEILQSELNATNIDEDDNYDGDDDPSQVVPSSHGDDEAIASNNLGANERDENDDGGVTNKVKKDESNENDSNQVISTPSTNNHSESTTTTTLIATTTDRSTSLNNEEETSKKVKAEETKKSNMNNSQPAKTYFTLDKYKITITGIIKDIKVEEKNVNVPINLIREEDGDMGGQESDNISANKNNFEEKKAENEGHSFRNTCNEQSSNDDFQMNGIDDDSDGKDSVAEETKRNTRQERDHTIVLSSRGIHFQMSSSDDDSDDDSDDKDSVVEETKQNTRNERDHTISSSSQGNDHRKKISTRQALCCYKCLCPKKAKQRSGNVKMSCGNSGNKNLFHNFCCHDIPKRKEDKDWVSPLMTAIDTNLPDPKPPTLISLVELEESFEKANVQEKEFQQRLWNPDNTKTYKYKAYKTIKKSNTLLGPLVVLDIYSGIGGAISGLKKLGIAMRTIISVEKDPVARHVAKFNHVKNYNENIEEDNIKFIEKFHTLEELVKNLDTILKNYGPIDLVIGKPLTTHSGKHITDLGNLIVNIQAHPLQKEHTVLFLIETMIHKRLSFDPIVKAFNGIPPVLIDSGCTSPCSKSRTYWSNLPIRKIKNKSQAEQSQPTFDDGFELPEKYCNELNDDSIIKAKSFQSLKYIDDDRMMKVKEIRKEGQTLYEIQKFSIPDRERMLGFKVGYVKDAINDLFKHLKEDAFSAEFSDGAKWTDTLHEKYFDMVECKYGFKSSQEFYDILIAPPDESKNTPSDLFFTKETYAKHLLGNTTSVSVMAHLLSQLKKICQRRQYNGFDYDFMWIDQCHV